MAEVDTQALSRAPFSRQISNETSRATTSPSGNIAPRRYNPTPDRLNLAFAAVADPTRRAILARLALGEADVSELMRPFNLGQPTISKHLNVLEHAGLVSSKRDAQRHPRVLVPVPLKDSRRPTRPHSSSSLPAKDEENHIGSLGFPTFPTRVAHP